VVITLVPGFNDHFTTAQNWDVSKMLEFVPVFLAGSLLFLYREKIPDSGLLAVGSAVGFLLGFALPLQNQAAGFRLTGPDLTAPFLAYLLLWLGMHLPFQRVGSRNDYSYGVYIYAFPVQQLLYLWGVSRWGLFPYTVLSVCLTVPLAVASWWLIEKHALKLKKVTLHRTSRPPSPSPSPLPAPLDPAIQKE